MSLSPQVLLASLNRERCVSNLRDLPALIFSKNYKNTVNASVLLPICIENDEVCLLYTKRSSNLKSHRGQIAFPGGKADEKETVFETALRETEEEIGVPRELVDLWSAMPLVQGRDKNMFITPVVGFIQDFGMDKLVTNPSEVAEVFTVSMKQFCDPTTHAYYEFERKPLPIFVHGNHMIWGITGMITHMFLQCFLPESEYQVDFMRKQYDIDYLMSKL